MQRSELLVPAVALAAVAIMMLAELKRSRTNEARLRRRGAVEPIGDVHHVMAFVYPGIFIAMTVEGMLAGPSPDAALIAGFATFVAAKLLKVWAITALGPRWSYRVLVLPGEPLVSSGPYAYLRHPNYLAVVGEIAGFALIVGARFAGVLSLVVFGVLMRKRIKIEENAILTHTQ
jgi:methyltransferase